MDVPESLDTKKDLCDTQIMYKELERNHVMLN